MFVTDAKTALAVLLMIGGVCTSPIQTPSQEQRDYQGDLPSRTGGPVKAAPQGEKNNGSNTAKDDLQGSWTLVSGMARGHSVSLEEARRFGIQWTFKGHLLDRKVKVSRLNDEGTYSVDPAKNPKTPVLTLTAGRDKGKTFLGIYKIEQDTLTICQADTGEERPVTFESPVGSRRSLLVFRPSDKK